VPPVSTAKRRASRDAKKAAETSASVITLKHKQSGKEKRISTGFAWDLFLCAGLFGIPLFWRRLHPWGAIVLALWCVDLLIGRLPIAAQTARSSEAALFAVFLALQLWLGFRGNRLTAKTYLAHGWVIEQPNDARTKRVIERWKLGN
jgi:hypothetical protein